ncbi:MAG: hypothetical protein ABW116_10315 [Candidatus Sedimenticola sp. 20ELBAFRAG]
MQSHYLPLPVLFILCALLLSGCLFGERDEQLSDVLEAVEEGGDPGQLLPATAAGTTPVTCDSGLYFYGTSSEGVAFVRHAAEEYLAAHHDRKTVYMKLGSSGYSASEVSSVYVGDRVSPDLGRVLSACMNSPVEPMPTGYRFRFN